MQSLSVRITSSFLSLNSLVIPPFSATLVSNELFWKVCVCVFHSKRKIYLPHNLTPFLRFPYELKTWRCFQFYSDSMSFIMNHEKSLFFIYFCQLNCTLKKFPLFRFFLLGGSIGTFPTYLNFCEGMLYTFSDFSPTWTIYALCFPSWNLFSWLQEYLGFSNFSIYIVAKSI